MPHSCLIPAAGDDDNAPEAPILSAEEVAFEESVEDLMGNGVTEEDARAALRYCDGDILRAGGFIAEV